MDIDTTTKVLYDKYPPIKMTLAEVREKLGINNLIIKG